MSFWDQVDSAGRRTFGRSNAGRLSNTARVLRIGSAVLATSVVVGSIAASGGIALPVWALVGLGVAMAINGTGIPLSWVGNHMKMVQYEDAEGELLADIQDIANRLTKPGTVPAVTLSEKLMKASRKASDINGVAGAVLSLVSGAATIGLYTPAAPVAAGVMLVSRASAVISAGVNIPITRNRIKVHRRKLAELQALYTDLSEQTHPAHARAVNAVLDHVFDDLSIRRDEPHLNRWLHFSLYKALFSHPLLQQNGIDATQSDALVTLLTETVTPLLKQAKKPTKGSYHAVAERIVDKAALKAIDRLHHHYSSEERPFKASLAALDALAVLGMKLQDSITENIPALSAIAHNVTTQLRLNPADGFTKRLQFQIRRSLLTTACSSPEAITQKLVGTILPYLQEDKKSGYSIPNLSRLQAIGLPDGATKRAGYPRDLPHYHMAMLGQAMEEGLASLTDPEYYEARRVSAMIANAVIRRTGLNPDNSLTQQLYTVLSHGAATGHQTLAQQQESITRISDAVLPYCTPETYRPKKSLKLRKKETGYSIIESDTGQAFQEALVAYNCQPAAPSQPKEAPIIIEERRRPPAPAVVTSHASQLVHRQKKTPSAPPAPIAITDVHQSYAALKTSLTAGTPLTSEMIQEQQEKLDRFKQQAEAFILVKKYKDSQGNNVVIWDDPDATLQGNTEHQITYIVNRGGKITVRYGNSASGVIAMGSRIEHGIGVQLLEIEQGTHTMLGDSRNQLASVQENTRKQPASTYWQQTVSASQYSTAHMVH